VVGSPRADACQDFPVRVVAAHRDLGSPVVACLAPPSRVGSLLDSVLADSTSALRSPAVFLAVVLLLPVTQLRLPAVRLPAVRLPAVRLPEAARLRLPAAAGQAVGVAAVGAVGAAEAGAEVGVVVVGPTTPTPIRTRAEFAIQTLACVSTTRSPSAS
jgi:hypothetical protein